MITNEKKTEVTSRNFDAIKVKDIGYFAIVDPFII